MPNDRSFLLSNQTAPGRKSLGTSPFSVVSPRQALGTICMTAPAILRGLGKDQRVTHGIVGSIVVGIGGHMDTAPNDDVEVDRLVTMHVLRNQPEVGGVIVG